jgi:hypothetical protein
MAASGTSATFGDDVSGLGPIPAKLSPGERRLLTVSKRTLDQRGTLLQMPCPRDSGQHYVIPTTY